MIMSKRGGGSGSPGSRVRGQMSMASFLQRKIAPSNNETGVESKKRLFGDSATQPADTEYSIKKAKRAPSPTPTPTADSRMDVDVDVNSEEPSTPEPVFTSSHRVCANQEGLMVDSSPSDRAGNAMISSPDMCPPSTASSVSSNQSILSSPVAQQSPVARRRLLEALETEPDEGSPSTPTPTMYGSRGDRWSWLEDVRDEEGRRPGDPDYDPRTLYIPKSAWNGFSPFERQYWEIKCKHNDVILFFKKGKFYELYETDAQIGFREFNLKKTNRVNMSMVGVPEGSFGHWASKFVALGYKIGRVDQMETMGDKNKAGGKAACCQRELCKILTAGTLTDLDMIETSSAAYLMAIKEVYDSQGNSVRFGICAVDAATGQFLLTSFDDDCECTQLETALFQLKPKEIVVEKGVIRHSTMQLLKRCLGRPIVNAIKPDLEFLSHHGTQSFLDTQQYFGTAPWPESLQQASTDPALFSAIGACVWYLNQVKLDEELVSQRCFQMISLQEQGTVYVSGQTLSNLEILENNSDGSKQGTLLEQLDRTVSSFGGRLFRQWLCHPLRSTERIKDRYVALQDLGTGAGVEIRECLQQLLRGVPDLERLLSRIHADSLKRPLGVMYSNTEKRKIDMFCSVLNSFERTFAILQGKAPQWICELESSRLRALLTLDSDGGLFPDMRQTVDFFQNCFDREQTDKEGYFVPKQGVNEELDAASSRVVEIEEQLENMLMEIRREFKCPRIKFTHALNKAYQIEIPKSALPGGGRTPAGFELISQTKDVGRFTTEQCQLLVEEHDAATDRKELLMKDQLRQVLEQFDEHYVAWMHMVHILGELDCLCGLSMVCFSSGRNFCHPDIVDSEQPFLDLKECWHPCIRPGSLMSSDFIPNDIRLGLEDHSNVVLLTGPNMGGKSTLLRQACLATIMAQIGCFVPASSCRLSPVDRIFTRVGAQDRIMEGQSTFMIELQETSNILRHATKHSLVILDELGRGTSTFDGYSLAYAVIRHLASTIRCRTLFATHYHLLTDDIPTLGNISLYHMQCHVDSDKKEVLFLYKFLPGVCPKSYGLNVAYLAGIPAEVVELAEAKSAEFEDTVTAKSAWKTRCKLFCSLVQMSSLSDTSEEGIQQHLESVQGRLRSMDKECAST